MAAWLQANVLTVAGALIIGWMLWQRLIAPRLAGVKPMDASDYLTFRNTPHTLIDVRSLDEWNSAHPASARHIPLGEIDEQSKHIPQDKPVVFICASGMRSASAAAKVAKAGHADVYNFSGGLGSWDAAGLPVKR
jgi:rhodanese-related sulfurtransferase